MPETKQIPLPGFNRDRGFIDRLGLIETIATCKNQGTFLC